MKTQTIRSKETQEFPFVASYTDYHEIDLELSELNKKYGKVYATHLGCDGKYWALFWVQKNPTNQEVKELLKNANSGIWKKGII